MPGPAAVEQALVAYLKPLLAVQVGTRVPNPRPASFVVLSRAGGQRANLAQSAVRVLIECWAASHTAAWDLAVKAWDALEALSYRDLPPNVELGYVDLDEPVNFPDNSSGLDRYQFLISLTVNLKEPS